MSSKSKSDVTSLTAAMAHNWTNLVPLAISLVAYFYAFIPMEHQTMAGMVLKCWPIFALQYLVYMQGVGLNNENSKYKSKIFVGLIFGCIGDAFLDFPGYFLHGTASFGVQQILYIWAFGFKPLNLVLGLKLFAVMGIPLYFVMPNLMKEDTLLLTVVTIYAPLLKVMVWRSCARAADAEAGNDSGKNFARMGGISFAVSDATLAINKYYMPVPYAQAIIMSTYYFAQFGIAMSTTQSGKSKNSKSASAKSKSSKDKTKSKSKKAS